MTFINPKTDFAFKKIFGSPDSKDVLISFLNAILYQDRPVIEDLEILDPYLAPQIKGAKNTYLDVKAKITGNKTVIIEMQVLHVESFEKRILYNAAKAYSVQLKTGEDYRLLNPVIALTITDFKMFDAIDHFISYFVLKEKHVLVNYPIGDLELVFVELPKFDKALDELETLADKWIYFLKSARLLNSVPEPLQQNPPIQKAFEIAREANLSPKEMEDLEKQEIFIQDQRGVIERALRIGMERGMERGIERGIKAGKVDLILRLLTRRFGTLEPSITNRVSELSVEQFENLGEAMLDFNSTEDLNHWLQTH
ncbi:MULTISPECIES: Rpn family recombination-promoting nuclease/putative transposase [unclassified Coleofasciculus]|uniref:Rpn family recombination-promoting nuclease/putative transposase n=1 Tax=unclassified Coleofasciculus TaxID=2692782 RepID=UPI00187FC25E|nr:MULTISPECIES: Rpn family recombination-promoting nuclease/putative transposase [unclassified Coleofasciculus]MBE9129117.1 Rpn family recombination-promoting nuclease/putative transposase [Coleofasciculus sp. LEGE 07081]MBE9149779.1 Rpn family recombination-promoting nuclease/putative transposase [Coleofasciculus sp. LEGE 07092]